MGVTGADKKCADKQTDKQTNKQTGKTRVRFHPRLPVASVVRWQGSPPHSNTQAELNLHSGCTRARTAFANNWSTPSLPGLASSIVDLSAHFLSAPVTHIFYHGNRKRGKFYGLSPKEFFKFDLKRSGRDVFYPTLISPNRAGYMYH